MAEIKTVEMLCEGQIVKVNESEVEDFLSMGLELASEAKQDAPKRRGRPPKAKAEAEAEGQADD